MKPKCPKCKSEKIEIIETWKDATIAWVPWAMKFSDGQLDPGGGPYKVEGICLNCGHGWRFRGRTQVDPEWFDKEIGEK